MVVIAALVGLVLVIGVGVVAMSILKKPEARIDDPQSSTLFAPDLTKTKEPSAVLTVGKTRYQSPCRLLPEPAIESIFGKFEDTGKRYEDYFYKVPDQPKSALSAYTPDIRCTVKLSLASTSISVQPTYYTDVAYATQALTDYAPSSPTAETYKHLVTLQQRLEADSKSAQLSPDEVAPALAIISRTIDMTAKKKAAFDKGDYLGKSIAVGEGTDSLVYDAGTKVFIWRVGATTIHLTIPLAKEMEKNAQADIATLSSKEVAALFAKALKASSVISKHAVNESLPQGPASSYFGRTDGTKMYDPCTVVDTELFESTLGLALSPAFSQTSTYHNADAAVPSTSKKTGQSYSYPNSNSCEVNFGANMTSGAGGTTTLELLYPSNEQKAIDLLGYLKEIFDETAPLALSDKSEGWIAASESCSATGICSSTLIARKGQVLARLYILRSSSVSLSSKQQTKMLQSVLDTL